MNIKPYLYVNMAHDKFHGVRDATHKLMEIENLSMKDAYEEVKRQGAELLEETKDFSDMELTVLRLKQNLVVAEDWWNKTKEKPSGGMYFLGKRDALLRVINDLEGK